jgi:hypothetical protein
MWKALCLSIVLMGLARPALSQASSDGTTQVVGLFIATCVRFAGDPKSVRTFMSEHHVPELNPQGRAIFLRDHVGIGFDASNRVTRLALVSEDNGVCSAFAGQADRSRIGPLLESVAKRQGFALSPIGGNAHEAASSSSYQVKIKDHLYKLIVSSNSVVGASVQAAITLAP